MDERDKALEQIHAAREKYNRELDEQWGRRGPAPFDWKRERRNNEIREGRERSGDDWERKVLDRLADVLERLAKYLEEHGGSGSKLYFKLRKITGGIMGTVNISSIQRVNSQVGVATASSHGLSAGDSFAIDGVSDSSLNSAQGAAQVLSDGLDTTHFMFNQAGPDTSVLSGGTVTSAGASGGGTGGGGSTGGSGNGTVGTPSAYGLTVEDQNGAAQALPSGVTPQVSVVDGNGGSSGATASLSSDNATVTVNYTAAGTYTITVKDPSGQVQDGSATETVVAGGGGGGTTGTLKFVLTKQGGSGSGPAPTPASQASRGAGRR